MIRAPKLNHWRYRTGNTVNTRPSSTLGTSITPGNNTYGSYTQILAGGSITEDCYLMQLKFHSVAVAAAAKDMLITIGIDPSGGSSYTDWVTHLLASCAGTVANGGIVYTFPLFVPAGAALAAKASVNNATVGTVRVDVRLFGLPTAPETIRWGTYVDTFGAVTGSSRGTAVTSGGASEGSWTNLGTETREHWWWQVGMGVNDSTMSLLTYFADLAHGDGSNKVTIFDDVLFSSTTGEELNRQNFIDHDCYAQTNGSEDIFGRLQCSGTADSNTSLCAYGVGG